MPSSIRSSTSTKKLSKNLEDLKIEFKNYQNVIKKNTHELSKINQEIEINKLKEIQLLQERINNLSSETRLVKNDEPALKIDRQHMLKRLDIL